MHGRPKGRPFLFGGEEGYTGDMNKRSGFGVIEVLVVVAVVGILVAGVMVWWHGGGVESLRRQFGSATHPVPTPNPRAGWETYASELDKIMFSYPGNWELSGGVVPNEDWAAEVVKLTSPSGLEITFNTPVDGLGGTCEEGNADCLITVRGHDPLAELVNGQRLHVVQYWNTLQQEGVRRYAMFVTDEKRLSDSEQFYGLYYPMFEGKSMYTNFGNARHREVMFGLTKELPIAEMSVDAFYEQAELRQAELILSSLRY